MKIDINVRRHRTCGSFVYFIQPIDGGLIKIGVAVHPASRLRHIQACSPLVLKVLRLVAGDHDLENEIHTAFRFCRQHGEWFEPVPLLLGWIDLLPNDHFTESTRAAHRYYECPRCNWIGPLGRTRHTCHSCKHTQLTARQASLCQVCADTVLDIHGHEQECRTTLPIWRAGPSRAEQIRQQVRERLLGQPSRLQSNG